MKAGETIQQSTALSAAKWKELAEQAAKYKRWKNQSAYSVKESLYSDIYAGVTLTASTYNAMAEECGISTRVTGGANGTIITANLFIELSDAVS